MVDQVNVIVITMSRRCPLFVSTYGYILSMNNQEWINDQVYNEVAKPAEPVEGEKMYTLMRGDFLKMPDIDYLELAKVDSDIQALLN